MNKRLGKLYPEGKQGYKWIISAVKNAKPCSCNNSMNSLELKHIELHRKWMEGALIVEENCKTALKYSVNREDEILECPRKIRLTTEAGISNTPE
jgi:hypothetical protein